MEAIQRASYEQEVGLAKFVAPDWESFSWQWNRTMEANLGINIAEAEQLVTADFGEGAAIQWS